MQLRQKLRYIMLSCVLLLSIAVLLVNVRAQAPDRGNEQPGIRCRTVAGQLHLEHSCGRARSADLRTADSRADSRAQ